MRGTLMSLRHIGTGASDASISLGARCALGRDRRSFLKSVVGAAAASTWRPGAALFGAGATVLRSDRAAAERERLVQPMEIRSQGGVLETTLTAAPHRLQIGETELPGFFYNGTYLPPLWRVRLGDVMRVRLRNELTEGFTNLHFHGMSVSPRGRSDNVFIHLLPGHEFHYEVMIPRAGRQEPGLYWYHPHGHGFTALYVWLAIRTVFNAQPHPRKAALAEGGLSALGT
jgi:suppressor of ftsI